MQVHKYFQCVLMMILYNGGNIMIKHAQIHADDGINYLGHPQTP